MQRFLSKIRILPILIFVAALSFGERFSSIIQNLRTPANTAYAETVEETPDPAELAAPDIGDLQAESAEEGNETDTMDLGFTPPDQGEWADPLDSDFEFSSVQMELFEDLSERRETLEEKEKEIMMREALLKAAEQELDQKYKEMTDLRSEIQDLLKQQSEEEQQQLVSLVKIYEGMKAKDAARIFNTLDINVLLEVMGKMSERKSAPIIAAMNPERARTITIMMAEQKSLPDLSSDFLR